VSEGQAGPGTSVTAVAIAGGSFALSVGGSFALFVADPNGGVFTTAFHTLSHFTFDNSISAQNRDRLIDRHRFALDRVNGCGNLSQAERDGLLQAYHKPIHHTTLNNPNANASAQVGGSQLNVNFGVLFPQGNEEISQTLIHEMMHCASFTHPDRRDPPAGMSCAAPNPAIFDCPGDNGVYYGTPPLRAEFCIAGDQSDMMMRMQAKAGQESCVIDQAGEATIYRR
jgi:hypothetical protein